MSVETCGLIPCVYLCLSAGDMFIFSFSCREVFKGLQKVATDSGVFYDWRYLCGVNLRHIICIIIAVVALNEACIGLSNKPETRAVYCTLYSNYEGDVCLRKFMVSYLTFLIANWFKFIDEYVR